MRSGLPRQGDPVALVLDRLEVIIDLLKMQIGGSPSDALAQLFPDLAQLFRNGGTPAANMGLQTRLLEYLFAAALPSAPQNVNTITVGLTEEPLASNESQPLMRVDVTNLNVAQPLLVSKRGVGLNAGRMILARETMPFVLPQGSQLFGIVALGTILVSVSTGYDMQPIVHAALTGGE